MNTSANTLFQLHFPTGVDKQSTSPLSPTTPSSDHDASSPPLLALGMLQWGEVPTIYNQRLLDANISLNCLFYYGTFFLCAGTTPFDDKVINGSRGMLTESEAREIYQAFRSRGVVLFDTAEGYGGGTSEKRLGRLLQQEEKMSCGGKKEMISEQDDSSTVATDIMEDLGSAKTAAREKHAQCIQNKIIVMTKFLPVPWRFNHAHFEKALRASNERMGVSKCPIYLLHSPMHIVRDIEYWVESAVICKRKGLLEKFGLSNCSAGEVKRAVHASERLGLPGFVAVNQVNFSLLDFNSPALQEMQRTCNELNVSIIAYNSLGQGLLTDNLTREKFDGNKPARMMRIKYGDLVPLRAALREIADNHSVTVDGGVARKKISMAQVALSWARGKGTIPLVGCRSKQQAEDTLASMSLHLTSEEVRRLDSLALTRCTFDGPAWRRKLFVMLAGIVMTACRWLDCWGVGRQS